LLDRKMIRRALESDFAPDRQIKLGLTEVRNRSSENNIRHITRQLDLLNIGRLITLFEDQPAAEILQGDCLAVILRFPGAPGLEGQAPACSGKTSLLKKSGS